ncbi:very short patch repair endonuclease [Mycolicibacterium austroafricanum]|uniref:very short patch repair endonuclease n=1 Tax=Mycolicibacterium austroafricanum TaxID=39687 RepID=UPI003AF32793
MSGDEAKRASDPRPVASSISVSSRMSKQRRRDTEPELMVRRILFRRGIRYRVDAKPEPDIRCKADIVWRRLRLVVFIDGCFWHGCPVHATRPKANVDWWAQKLDGNIRRDRRIDAELAALGWTVMRFWEHEDPSLVADAICEQLTELRTRPR